MKELILIDDDELVRMTWEFKAKSSGLTLHCFTSGSSFIKAADSLDKNIPIYLDSDLGVEKGEDLAVEFIEMGFSEIHLVTGKEASKVEKKELFKSIRGKEPPF